MRKDEGEAMSSFNKRFARLYYNMPKEIQPLDGAVKIHCAFVFLPDLSLFLLQRKSFSLQKMFANALEVEENFRLSGRLPDHSGNDGNGKRMKQVEL